MENSYAVHTTDLVGVIIKLFVVKTYSVLCSPFIRLHSPCICFFVRNKAGKKVEFGLPYLLSRLGGGYVFGTMIQGVLDETRMPLEALRGYRAIFGPEATPELMVYDRGGGVKSIMDQLAKEGIQQVGVQPKGKEPWRVAEEVREVVRSERGKTEGIIGTLKSDKYNFNKPKERLWPTLEMVGPRSILSFNLNKLMRDVVQAGK